VPRGEDVKPKKEIELVLRCTLVLADDAPAGVDADTLGSVSFAGAIFKGLGSDARQRLKIIGVRAGTRKLSYVEHDDYDTE
jgi:hypothetical protein